MCAEMDNDEDTLGIVPNSDCVQDVDLPEATSNLTEQTSLMNGNAHAWESKQDDLVSADGDENESAEVTRQITVEEEEQLDLSPELQEGLKILNHFLADKLCEPFRDEVVKQLSEADAEKYRREIDNPMCLFRMNEKFRRGEYDSITHVVNDFQLIIYNCQRFNGTSHRVSKRANKMAVILKQKLALLRQDIRSKIAQDSSQPWLNRQENCESSFGSSLRKRTTNQWLDDSSAMVNHLRMEEELKAKEERRQKKEESKAAHAAAEKSLIDWEEENITKEPIKSVIRHSWEIPQIGLFLFLCRDILGLEEIPMYELERCLAMPHQSRRLQQIMTALLSNEHQLRDRLDNKGPEVMPYAIWTRKLCKMMDEWYTVLDKTCRGDKFRAACKLGLIEQSFNVIGLKNPLREKPFHCLSFYKKIWILKSVCDYLVNKKDKFRLKIESHDPLDQRGLVMGTDRYGNQYIHFMQFCGPDLRIYRQRKPPVPVVREEEENEEEEDVAQVRHVKGRSRAKRKLNLDGSNGKWSRSTTPLNDSETDGTVSPALSDVRTKSRASSSRHSSPMPCETYDRSRQASARNSPALDCSSLESFCLNLGKGRKTRNSAESNFFENVDLEEFLRKKSRRSRKTKNTVKEMADAESISTLGDESSQDGLRADTPSSTCALDIDSKTEVELVNGKLNSFTEDYAWAQSDVKLESQDFSDADSDKKGYESIHSHTCLFENYRTDTVGSKHIKLEPISIKCDKDTESQNSQESCDKVNKELASPTSMNAENTAANGSSIGSSCDISSRRAAQGHLSSSRHQSTTPVSAHTPTYTTPADTGSLKKEGGYADDSGFVSFQTSPHIADAGAVCDRDHVRLIPGSSQKKSAVDRVKQEQEIKSEDQCDCDVKNKKEEQEGEIRVKEEPEQVKVRSEGQGENSKVPDGESSQNGVALDSAGFQQKEKSQATSNAVLNHVDCGEEEMVPDAADFELIVVDMDGLDRLVKQFEPELVDASPHISTGARSGKRQKSRSTPKPIKNFTCEKELYDHFTGMQKELQKFRSKLSQSTRKSRLKLQREFLNHVEELPREDDLRYWERKTEADSDTEQAVDETAAEGLSQPSKDNDNSEEITSNKTTPVSNSKTKSTPKSAALATVNAEPSSGPDQRDIEEYEADVSSRGRLRKRRLIPNNVEDQGVKKKKMAVAVVKKADEVITPAATKVMTSASSSAAAPALSGLITTMEDGTIKLNISNEEFFTLVGRGGPEANALVQQLAAVKSPSGQALAWKPQGIRVVGRPMLHGSGAQKSVGAAGQSSKSHPVIQKILSTQSPGTVRPVTGVTVQRNKANVAAASAPQTTPVSSLPSAQSAVAMSVAVASPSVPSVSKVPGTTVVAGGLSLHPNQLLMATTMKGGKQQVFVVTPEQQKELMRSGILRPQQIRQPVVVQAGNSLIRPPLAATVTTTAGSMTGLGSVVVSVSHSMASGAKGPMQGAKHVNNPQGQLGVTGLANSQHRANPSIPVQGVTVTPPKGSVTAVKIVPSSNGQEMVGVPVVVGQVVPQGKGPVGLKTPVIINNNATVNRTLILHSAKAVPKYAGNVTVKELLESRAASSKSEDSDNSPSSSQESSSNSQQNKAFPTGSNTTSTIPLHGRIVVTTTTAGVPSVPLTVPLTVVTTMTEQQPQLRVAGMSVAPHDQQQLVAGLSPRLPGQLSLDHALQTVVTPYHTTLPTADIKVPSPTTLPSLSPRKSVTRIVHCSKAPIPTTTKVQAKHSPVQLTSTLMTCSANRFASGVNPGGGAVVRPGTMVMPTGQTVDVSCKEQVVVQMLPPGGLAQKIMLPNSGSSLLQLAGKIAPGKESSALPLSVQAQSLVNSASATPSLLTTVLPSSMPISSTLMSEGSSASVIGTKTTSEVLKSMLVAKALTYPIPTSAATAVLPTTVLSTSGAQATSQTGPFLTQHTVSPLTQMPRVIRAPVVGLGGSGVTGVQQVIQHGGPRMVQPSVGVQLQNLAVAGLPATSAKSVVQAGDSQRPVQGVVRMALPGGLHIAGLQPGTVGTAIQLVAGGQPVGGSNLQPMLATIKPGAQGLQQLQLLAGGLQGIQLTGQPQQSLAFKAASSVSPQAVGEDQKATVQLCLAMPNGAPTVIQSSSSTIPHGLVQGTASLRPVTATATLQGNFPVLGSPPLSPSNSGTLSKVIMASPATSLPVPASTQQAVCSGVVSQVPVKKNRTLLSITPGNVKSQYIISPVSSQGEVTNAVLIQSSMPSDSQPLSTQPPAQLLSTGIKRTLPSADIQPIPAKNACLDTASSKNSGTVLAGLNQMIVGGGKTVAVSGDAATAATSLQRVVMASSGGDNSASCTLLNLAAHVSPVNTLVTAPISSTSVHASAPLLQGMAPTLVSGKAQQMVSGTPVQKQPVLVVRNVGGQLLTDNNIPVTENNGHYKVLPKATLQLGSQTVTVLSPSSAMIHNVRNPAAGSSIKAQETAPCQNPPSTTLPSALSIAHMEGTVSSVHNQAVVQTVLRPDAKLPLALSGSQAEVKPPIPDQAERTVCQDSGAVGLSVAKATVALEAVPAVAGKQAGSCMNSTPLLKARLEQPRLGETLDTMVQRETVNGLARPAQQHQQGGEESGVASVQDNSEGGLAMQDHAQSDRENNVEEETALQLLRLADQM